MKYSSLIKRTIVFVLIVVVLGWLQHRIAPMVEADSAMLQLEDSDAAYAQFTAIQDVVRYFWVTYPLSFILVYYGYFKKLKKNKGDQKDEN